MKWLARINKKQLVVGILLVVFVFMMMDLNSRLTLLNSLSQQRNAGRAEYVNLLVTKASLETQIAYATSAAAVEDYAYDMGHMARPGDIIIVPVPQKNITPTPVLESIPTIESVDNWEVWKALILGQ